MPVSRSKKNHKVNKTKRKAFLQKVAIRNLALKIRDQATLDYCLLDVDFEKRRAMFELLKPLLPFSAEFPSTFNPPALVKPPALILP